MSHTGNNGTRNRNTNNNTHQQNGQGQLATEGTRKRHKECVIEAPVKRYIDTLWQQDPPRLIKYRPSHLHSYGWIPILNFRNVSATIASSSTMWVQAVLLVGWMLLLHITGLNLPEDDLKSFSLVFGTPYLGAIFNGCMVVTFLLGMFASLVYNRWWAIRQAYAKISSTTIDLSLMIANQIKPYVSAHRETAALELVRLLNLGHILMLQSCDKSSQDFHNVNLFGGLFSKSSSRCKTPSTQEEHGLFRQRFKYMNYNDLSAAGLVNKDEWDKLRDQNKLGLEPYVMVYYWARALAAKCQEKGLLKNCDPITAKIGSIVEAASTIFTFIRTQMPYHYVHLVSCMVHIYLFFLASYLGLFLHIGFPNDRITETMAGAKNSEDIKYMDTVIDNKFENAGLDPQQAVTFGMSLFLEIKLKEQFFTAIVLYVVVVAMNCVLQGMLDMHTLLDNPFGQHVTKFPLRQSISEVMTATKAMLKCSHDLPLIFNDIQGDREDENNGSRRNVNGNH